jgi:predicted nucleotidyltransferase
MTTPVDSKDTAVQRILAARQRLTSLGVRSTGLFGSFVRGQQSPS